MWCNGESIYFSIFLPFSSWEAMFLLASTKNCDLWPDPIFWAWAESRPIRFVKFDKKSLNHRLPVLDQPRGHHSQCRPKGVLPLETRMFFFLDVPLLQDFIQNEEQLTLRLKQQWKQWEMACGGQDKKHPSSSFIYNSHEAERKTKKKKPLKLENINNMNSYGLKNLKVLELLKVYF